MRSPINLLQETINELEMLGYTPADVLWVGSRDGNYAMAWDEFANIADFVYDCGYTWSNNINEDLVVVGSDWWLERKVGIQGVEMWKLHWYPQRKENARPFNTVQPKPPHDRWWDEQRSTNNRGTDDTGK